MLKKMKVVRKSIVVFMAVLLSAGIMQAQVRIGQNEAPRGGVILDLAGGYKGGLLLPRVKIDDLGKIPMDFSDVSVRGKDDVPELAGLVVWNTRQNFEGVYMWDGTDWKRLDAGTPPAYPDCNNAPSIISITGFVNPLTLKLDEQIEITCTATSEGVTTYTWSFPAELTEVSGGGTNKIRLKATNPGTYTGAEISCMVTNACGSDVDKATSDLTVLNCSAVPAAPGPMSLSKKELLIGSTFTASVPVVSGVTYMWTLPSGLSGSSTTHEITITGNSSNTYAADKIKVVAVNDCGTSPECVSPHDIDVRCFTRSTVTGADGVTTYNVVCYPDGGGCWMIDNSKEGTPAADHYGPDNSGTRYAVGERGYYYTWDQATANEGTAVCPPGFVLPTEQEFNNLLSSWSSFKSCSGEYSNSFLGFTSSAGYFAGTWQNWDSWWALWLRDVRDVYGIQWHGWYSWGERPWPTDNLAPVRCFQAN
jgi:hypothetical protein